MKKQLLPVTLLLLLLSLPAFAQVPQKLNYQAVARNSSGVVLQNQLIGLYFSVRDLTPAGTILYSESFTTTTNQFGLFSEQLGTGTVWFGTFAGIDWANGDKYLEVSLDPAGGNNYTVMGVMQLVTVPYALVADKAVNMTADDLTDVNTTGATNGQVLQWNGTAWAPATAAGDNWGTQSAVTDFTLSGNGTSAAPLKLASQSATTGNVLKWTGTAWTPQPENAFTLPYSNTVSSSSCLFNITNNTTGGAVQGTSASTTNPAVYGLLTSGTSAPYVAAVQGDNQSTTSQGIGVYGHHSGTGWGVYGESNSGYGVVGYGGVGGGGVYGFTAGAGIGIRSIASGGGYTAIFTGGNMGVGTTAPTAQLEVAGTGSAPSLIASSPNATQPALQVSGALKVSGTNKTAFTLQGQNTVSNTNGYISSGTMLIDNPLCNNDPNAMLIVTHNFSANGNNIYLNKATGVFYNSGLGRWYIYTEDLSAMPLTAFNVLVIKQ